jgi:hypothetical protein
MLSDQLSRLLTAYVDGELRPREDRAVQRLLKNSEEARRLLERLQADAKNLQSLPRARLARDLSPGILERLAAHDSQVARKLPAAAQARPAWLGMSVAAAILVAVGFGSYLFFSSRINDAARPENAGEKIARADPTDAVRDDGPAPLPSPEVRKSPKPPSDAAAPRPESRPAGPAASTPLQPGQADSLPPADHQLEAAPVIKPPDLKSVTVPVALNLKLHELDQEKHSAQLVDEVARGQGHRFDIACKDTGLAMERLHKAFEACQIHVLLDQDAQDRLNLKGLKTPGFYVYSEDLTPDELLRVFLRLRTSDGSAELKRRGSGQFSDVVASELAADDYSRLSRILGVKRDYLESPAPRKPLAVDLRTPLPSKTREEVARALKGQGGKRGAGLDTPIKAGERVALVVVDDRTHPSVPSAQVRLYFASRPQAQRSAVRRVLMVLPAPRD